MKAAVIIFLAAVAILDCWAAPANETAPRSTTEAAAPVDQLIPWLLNEDRQLRGIPFSEVILDTTGKKVLV